MSSPKPTTAKPERRRKKLGRGLLEFFGKKKPPQALVSSSSQSLHSSDAGSIQKHNHKPSITIEESTLPVVEPVDVGASPYPQGTLHARNARSRQSLTSHKSKGSFKSNVIFSQNEKQWKMAYEIAIAKLDANERSQVDSDTMSSCSVYLVLDAANKARAERDENKWRYTKRNGEVIILRERFDKIVEGFAKYAGFLSSTTQHQQPDATGLVWVAARSLIEIYLNHKESVELIEGALKTIAVSMANCEFYASIFKDTLNKQFDHSETPSAWEKQLERALPDFYAAILVFSIKVKGYIMPSAIGRINKSMKPFSMTFQPHLKEIERKEMTLRELANMATMESVKDIRKKMDIVGEMRELFVQISDEKAMNWLSAISPITAYDFNKYRRLAGTCQWIFKTQKYQSWIDGTGTRDLWVVGIPGAGKSVLATSLIDELRGKEDSLNLYFFFRDGDARTMSPVEMVASIIAQLIKSEIDKERLMRILKLRVQSGSYFTSTLNESRDLGELSATLLEMLSGFPVPVIILLDALDECTDPSSVVHRLLDPAKDPSSIAHMMLLPSLGELHVQFLLTGRPNVHDIFAPLPYVSTIDMEVNEDIRKFVNEKVAGNESLRRHENQIIATIYENSQGMFRYAALVLEELNEHSPEPISKRLQAMPKGITGMYELILGRLGSKGGVWEHKMRQKLLLWVALAHRPVKVPEMQYACVTIEGDKSFDPDVVVLPTAKQMIAVCGSLLEVTSSNEFRFTHRTVKEFLLQPLDKLSEVARNDERVTSCMMNEAEGHARMTMTCVTQLFSNSLNQLATKLNPYETSFRTFISGMNRKGDQRGIPLSESPFHYAVSYWIHHAMKVPRGETRLSISKEVWELVRDFFWDQGSMAFIEWLRIFEYEREEWHEAPIQYYDNDVSGSSFRCLNKSMNKSVIGGCIHVAASYGLVDILEWAHPDGLDFDTRDSRRMTPLMRAAAVGEEDAVKVLLSNSDVDINRTTCIKKDCDGSCPVYAATALIYAVVGNRIEVVKILLAQPGIDVDLVTHGDTALGMAAQYRFPEVIELLCRAGAKVSLDRGQVIEIPTHLELGSTL
ncbi:hypothetical protein CPB86DRAFT_801526 [Serendipita vermifera]|nr:hypothetical protein CPB86DRAFT_801526 [Serendipita vermifera]